MGRSIGRGTRATWLAVALAAAGASGFGCAADGGLLPVLTVPGARHEGRLDSEQAYELGYRYGRLDDQNEKRADYRRYQDAYAWETESAFATGYRDGYSGSANRYRPDPRGWSDGERGDRRYGGDRDRDDDDDDRDVARAVPGWLVGDYRGWSQVDGVDVELTVYPNASVLFVTDGRARQGVYRSGQVHLRNGVYGISRLRDGIRVTQQGDARNSIYLRRSD